MSEEFQIGDWRFSPATGTLSRGDELRRLEHRAARVLELLYRRRGVPVSGAELVESVWEGRALSPNSVAVVIADLRRALDDDSRAPRYIETLPKRGYRLLVGADAEPYQGPPSRRLAIVGAGAALLAAGAAIWLTRGRTSEGFAVAFIPIVNATGDARYDPLTAAVSDLVATEIAARPGVRLVRADGFVQARMRGRLVLWNGQPSVSLALEDAADGTVLWSAMAAGPAGALPRQIHAAMANFGPEIEHRRGR